MYADQITESMERAIVETNRRRALQMAYNEANGITPETINRAVHALLMITEETERRTDADMTDEEKESLIRSLEDSMLSAAQNLDFEKAASLRDRIFALRGNAKAVEKTPQPVGRKHPKKRKR